MTNLVAQRQEERPLGWIQSAAGGATITPLGVATAIAAQPGDVLFTGDRIDGSRGKITLIYCPDENRNAGAAYQVAARSRYPIRIRPTLACLCRVGQSTVAPCLLPTARTRAAGGHRSSSRPAGTSGGLCRERYDRDDRPVSCRAECNGSMHSPRSGALPRQALLALGVIFENANRLDEAAGSMSASARIWPEQPRLLKHIQRLLDRPAGARHVTEPVAGRNTSAAPSGTCMPSWSEFRNTNSRRGSKPGLRGSGCFADAKYLESARGGKASSRCCSMNRQPPAQFAISFSI